MAILTNLINRIPYSETFSVDVLSDPGIHGTLTGSSTARQSTSLNLRLDLGSSWRSPALAITPLSYVKLSFLAKLDGATPPAGNPPQPYNRNNLVFRSINSAATWNLDPLNTGPTGGDLIAGDHTSLVALNNEWSEQIFYSRTQANAAQIAVELTATDRPFLIDDIRIDIVQNRSDVATWADQLWNTRYQSPNRTAPADIPIAISTEQQHRLSRTRSKLQFSDPLRIVVVGDSIVNDLSNSAFDVMLERLFPGSQISVITAVGGGTGLDQWNPLNATYPFINSTSYRGSLHVNEAIIEQQPDLILLGGISTPGNASGYAAIHELINKLRSASVVAHLGYQPDILLATGAFGGVSQGWYPSSNINALGNDYRSNLLAIANQNNAAFIDLAGSWGSYLLGALDATQPSALQSAEAMTNYWRDSVHANTFGKQVLGRALTRFLAASAAPAITNTSISLTASTSAITEDSPSSIDFTFLRTGPTTDPLTVYFTVGGTAVAGIDYTGLNNSSTSQAITFAAGATTATVSVMPVADSIREKDESVSLALDSLIGFDYTIQTDTPVTALILNDDAMTTTILTIIDNFALLQGVIPDGGFTNDTTPTLSGTLSAALNPGDRLVLYNGTTALADAVVNNTTLTWSATPTLGANGTYSFIARVVDSAGNQGPASPARSFILDTVAPLQTATISTIADNLGTIQGVIANGGITNDNTPTLAGTFSAALATGDVVTIYSNGTPAGNAKVTASTKTWTFTPTLSANGSYTFTAAVVDGAGNAGPLSTAYSISLDTVAPTQTVAITAVLDNVDPLQGPVAAGGRSNDTTPTLSGTLSAALNPGDRLVLYNGTTALADAVVNNTTLTWSATPTLGANGTYSFIARVVDSAGNQGPASPARSFILDTVAPLQTATISTIADNLGTIQGVVANGGITNDTTPTLAGTFSAALATGDVVTIYSNGTPAGNAKVTASTKTWTFTPTLSANGSYTFTAAVVDGAGNAGPLSTAYSISLDTVAPTQTVAITAVLDNVDPLQGPVAAGGRSNDTTPTLSGTLSAALNPGDRLVLYNGTTALADAVVNNTTLTWSATPTLGSDGTYSFIARVVDSAGNQGPASPARSFILDTVAPLQTATISTIADNTGAIQGAVSTGGITNDVTPTLSGTLSGSLAAGDVVTIYSNGIAAGNATVDAAALTWSFTPTLTANGSYTFTAAVVDGAGNAGPVSSPYAIQLDASSFDGSPWSYDWTGAAALAGTPGLLKASVQVVSPRIGEPALAVTALRVDLQTPGLSLTSTGPITNWQANTRETLTASTRQFITSSRQQSTPVVAAMNTAFFDLVDSSQALPSNLLGLAVSNNNLVSPAQQSYPYFALDSVTGARIEKASTVTPDLSTTTVAFAGMANGIVLWDNVITWTAEQSTDLNARTALGISSDQRYLVLMTVDRSLRSLTPSYWGATFNDVGALLSGFGASRGLNLDGAGSTQMAYWDPATASAQLLNAPLFGFERLVGSNLGIVYQPPI